MTLHDGDDLDAMFRQPASVAEPEALVAAVMGRVDRELRRRQTLLWGGGLVGGAIATLVCALVGAPHALTVAIDRLHTFL
jgi:hypothetical protein